MQNQFLKILFVINPGSGSKSKKAVEPVIRDYFKDKPQLVEYYSLKGWDEEKAVRNYIENFRPQCVVAVGGDGTIRMLAELVRNTEIVLGILPAGSANGMAKELGIPPDIIEALKIILNGNSSKMDAILINGKEICIHLSDVGINAMLVKYFEMSGARGMWGYAKAVWKVFLGKRNIEVQLITDSETKSCKAYMIVIANARTYGTGAVINPEGNIADGRFEIVIIRKLKLMELVKMVLTHKAFNPENIELMHAHKLELTTKSRSYFQIDGEFKGKTTKIFAEILPGCLNVIHPVP